MTELLQPMSPLYEDYLRDESRLQGEAQYIAFAHSVQEIGEVLAFSRRNSLPVTVQGSRTGIAGAAVPQGGVILNLTRMNRIDPVVVHPDGSATVTVEPGVLCSQLAQWLEKQPGGWFFPPDPTETSATLGGLFGCNARGVSSYRYGPAAAHVQGVELLLQDGSPLTIRRGECLLDDSGCTLPDGRRLALPPLPQTSSLPGLPCRGEDLLDLLAGSEGMLGVVTRLTLGLQPRPQEQWGVLFFFAGPEAALDYVTQVEALQSPLLCCAEFFDQPSLALVEAHRATMSSLRAIPDFPQGSRAAVYLELAAEEGQAEETLMTLLEAFEAMGGGQEQSWAGTGPGEMEKFRVLRHAVPEAINTQVDLLRRQLPQLHKLGLDFQCGDFTPLALYQLYAHGLAASGLCGYIFGHALQRHFHVNLLPQNDAQLQTAQRLITQLAGELARRGGTLAAENGVGKLKGGLVGGYLSPAQKETLAAVRSFFDPMGLLNPANMRFGSD